MARTTLTKRFGNQLKRTRKARGFSLRTFAELMGTSTVQVQRLENGSNARIESFERAARALGYRLSIQLSAVETKEKAMIAPQYRQGDVFIIAKPIPKVAKRQSKSGRIVLEHGEVTGHAHAIREEQNADLYLEGTRKFLEICLGKSADISHEEHSTITLPPGSYEVRRQVTWSALQQMAQVVAD